MWSMEGVDRSAPVRTLMTSWGGRVRAEKGEGGVNLEVAADCANEAMYALHFEAKANSQRRHLQPWPHHLGVALSNFLLKTVMRPPPLLTSLNSFGNFASKSCAIGSTCACACGVSLPPTLKQPPSAARRA
jgi:hypothetical protein